MKRVNYILLLVLCSTSAFAYKNKNRPDGDNNGGSPQGQGGGTMTDCNVPQSRALLDINNVRAMVLNAGDMWWDLDNAFYEIPKQNDPTQPRKHALFAGSVWIGGEDANTEELLVSGQTYRQFDQSTYWTGPVYEGQTITQDQCLAWDQHYKINASDIDDFLALDPDSISEDQIPQSIRIWPGRNNPFLLSADEFGFTGNDLNVNLAPFVDVDGDGVYNPLNGDYPEIRGDQSIWWIMNDVGNTKNFGNNAPPEVPGIGLEMKVLAFAFATNNAINNMTFYEQTIANKGTRQIDNCYMGQWVDADLGNFDDDFVGCDVGRGLGICYNGDDNDEGISGYGINPPSVGVDFFEGPLADLNDGIDNDRDCLIDEGSNGIDDDGDGFIDEEDEREKIIMSNFVYYNNDGNATNGNPDNAIHYYNYLRSIWKDGQFLTYDGADGTDQTAPLAQFMFPGNTDQRFGWGVGGNCQTPVATQPWSEETAGNTPADRRFLQSAGPFTLRPGDVNQITIGVVWARANSGGATGSFSRLLAADDEAQRLFDRNFQLLQGPNAPTLDITELDRELVLTIVPDTFTINRGARVFNTENYQELDPALGIGDEGLYRFQGYVVYQLRNNTVSFDQLDDPDQARVVVQSDVRDDISRIVNQEFDPDLDTDIPVIKVEGQNQGLVRSVRVRQDLFATGVDDRLVNYKRYYYLVVAYAYNGAANNSTRYLEGRFNVGVNGSGTPYVAIPTKSEFKNGGTTLNASFGSTVPVRRITGIGTGQNALELAPGQESEIVNNFRTESPVYAAGNSPISVKVYDPLRAVDGDFTLSMRSRLVYDRFNAPEGLDIQVGDTLISLLDTEIEDNLARLASGRTVETQTPGVAVVRFIENRPTLDEDPTIGLLHVETLNDEFGGTFTLHIDSLVEDGDDLVTLLYKYRPQPFVLARTGDTLTCLEYQTHDFWELIRTDGGGNGFSYVSRQPISRGVDELVPELGLSMDFRHGFNPGYEAALSGQFENYFLDASIEFDNALEEWIQGVPNTQRTWLRAVSGAYRQIDPALVYRNVLEGSIAPYAATANASGQAIYGAAYAGTSAEETAGLTPLGSVDIVLTDNKDLWTRVPVLQRDQGVSFFASFYGLIKTFKPSVNKEGIPDGTTSPLSDTLPSQGMSWFPGYAIDVNRGIRLNMMFSESISLQDSTLGNDLLWQPNDRPGGGGNQVYVMNSPYDGGQNIERDLDAILVNNNATDLQSLPGGNFRSDIRAYYANTMWVWFPRLDLNSGRTLDPAAGYPTLSNRARVRVRVQQYYTSFPAGENTNPTYTFSTQGLGGQLRVPEVASEALELIRAVPNPYYASSGYETSAIDTRVKFTNLPDRCTITIYTLHGTIVRQLQKDDQQPFLDWDLRNGNNIPIASGAYVVHVDAGDLGERVLKWFCVMRPSDLDIF